MANVTSISVIVPIYNEVENIERLHGELTDALRDFDAEIIAVDDGSTDGSGDEIRRFEAFEYVGIARSGKSAALRAGIERARAPIIVTIDADLQEDPQEISKMVGLLDENCDCVVGYRQRRSDDFFAKKLPSWIYRIMIFVLFGQYFIDINCGFRACRTDVLRSIPWFDGSHRLLPLMIRQRSGHVVQVPVRHRQRQAGTSKFSSPQRFFPALETLLKLRFGRYA